MKKLLVMTLLIGTLSISMIQQEVSAAPSNNSEPVTVSEVSNIQEIEFQPYELSIESEFVEPQYILNQDGSLSFEIRTGNPDLVPDKKLQYGSQDYVLDNYYGNLVAEHDQQIETITQEVLFTQAEQGTIIPDSITVPVIEKSGESEKNYDVTLILKEQFETNQRWADNFEASMTFYDYDADQFAFGNTTINKANALEELRDYDQEILQAINLDPGFYRIEGLRWSGEQYSNDGVICRNAIVYGKKLQNDILATYEAAITVNSPEKYLYIANYQPEEIVEEAAAEIAESEEMPESSFWGQLLNILKNPLVSLGLFIIICLVIVIIYILSKKKRESGNPNYIELRGEDED